MNDTVAAELRGLLRGALAATEKARDMAGDLGLPQRVFISQAGLSILAAIAHIEDDATVADSETKPAA